MIFDAPFLGANVTFSVPDWLFATNTLIGIVIGLLIGLLLGRLRHA